MTTKEPLVTAIIPSTGRPSLRAAVSSVAGQSVPTRILVVLDAPERLGEVRDQLGDLPVDLVATRGKVGGAGARKLGVEAAETQIVAFLDDDDTWRWDKVEQQLQALSEADIDPSGERRWLSATAMNFVRGASQEKVPTSPFTGEMLPATYLVQRQDLRYGRNAIQTSTLMLPRRLAGSIGWDQNLKKHQDWDFVIRTLEVPDCRFVWVDQPLSTVIQGSAASISVSPNWRASLEFYDSHHRVMSDKAASDFLFTQVLRSALAAGELKGVRRALAMNGKKIPHPAAAVVGLSGLVRLAKVYTRSRN